MRHLTAVMVALLTMVGAAAMAQDGDLPIQAGDKAFYFSMNGLGNFGVGNVPVGATNQGLVTGIEGKMFTRDAFAWRLGVSLQRNSATPAVGTEVVTTQVGIAPGFEYHFVTADRFSIYTGGVLSYAVFDQETKTAAGKAIVNRQGFGLAGLLGAEFYPWQNISLGAEYQAGFMTVNRPDTTNWGIASTGVVKLGFHF